jgi:hypothetical protein
MILSTLSYSQVANTPLDLILCDVDNNGFSQFDLESQTAEVLGAQDPTQFNVSYHDNLADAEANTNTLSSPYANSTPTAQTIFVRVTDLTTNNYTITSFNIIVNELPIANIVSDIEVCDDVTDGDDTNGFVQNFDLESQTAEVLGAQDPTQFNVSYHDNLADAEANTNTLSSPYANSTPTAQTIFVRITNTETGCFTTNDFTLIVNNCPTASVDDQNQLDISIYPNPTSDIVYIDGNYTQLKVVVYDILGKQVINKSITNSIDISQLEKGVYILQLSDGAKLTTQRIIKN